MPSLLDFHAELLTPHGYHVTMPRVVESPADVPRLPGAFFDAWRAGYATMTYAEHQEVYSEIARVYPEQQCYDREAVAWGLQTLVSHGIRPFVLELGGWKGELANEMLAAFPTIHGWHNIEICREAVAASRCVDPMGRYTAITLEDFFWRVKPRHIAMCNTLILSHVVEHLRLQDIEATIAHCATEGLQYCYIDLPAKAGLASTCWDGWTATHILQGGWPDLEAILATHGYTHWGGTLSARWYMSSRGRQSMGAEKREPYAYPNAS